MRRTILAAIVCALASTLGITAQTSTAAAAARVREPSALTAALIGEWTGVLQYRDYSEPPTSTKRVQLPTWLTISQAAEGLRFHYIYDDGPGKTVEEMPVVVIDAAAKTYTVISTDYVAQKLSISGLEQLKDGRGELILTGRGTENKKPADLRETVTVRRNLLLLP